MWQDYAMAIMSTCLSVAAVRQALHGYRERKQGVTLFTSALTATLLAGYVVCYLSLELYVAASTGTFSAAMWCVIAVQRKIYWKNNNEE